MKREPISQASPLYFLNERHQLAPSEKEGGRQPAKVLNVNWSVHGAQLGKNLRSVFVAAQKLALDPTAKTRLFVLAKPKDSLSRESSAQSAVGGVKTQKVDLAGKDAQIVERLGFNLLAVQKDGAAIVHATEERITQMVKTLDHLVHLTDKEQIKWAHLQAIDVVPLDFKASLAWWPERGADGVWSTTIDFQPLLDRSEVDSLVRAISAVLGPNEKLRRVGREFSGRRWISAGLLPATILRLVREFQAIYSIRPPLVAVTNAKDRVRSRPTRIEKSKPLITAPPLLDPATLPCVAVVDTGIPENHVILGPYRRPGGVVGEYTSGAVHDSHGTLVASRVVFGDVQCVDGQPVNPLQALCCVYDVNVGDGPGRIYPDSIDSAVATVTSSARDIRVFNCSFDANLSVDDLEGSYRDAWLRRIADVDNRAFSDDILFVVAAGNSQAGLLPATPYPNHFGDPKWKLRAWPKAFNAITCGGTSEGLSDEGVAKEAGAPSPFSRVGPGLVKSQKPDFSASAGNCDKTYRQAPGTGLGVWCCNEDGLWEDCNGTSFAAPLLAREAARVFAFLTKKCEAGTRPFAALVKAVLALRARAPELPAQFEQLAKVSLGFGSVTAEDVISPPPERAVFLWQGVLTSDDALLTVELPLPSEWISQAQSPVLKLVCAWDTPVNHAAEHVWACRKVNLTLRSSEGNAAFKSISRNAPAYPLIERLYPLTEHVTQLLRQDSCLMELSYTHQGMAPYPAGTIEFSPQQRVAIAYEIFDEDQEGASPHAAIQELPVAVTLDRLSTVIALRQSVFVRAH